jgi:hypothetical protein
LCPQKAGNRRFLNNHSRVGRKYHEDHHGHDCVAGACDGERDRDDRLYQEGACSAGLRGTKLLTIRPGRVLMGATVFVFGVLTGAGIAAWMMPPV